ncbi:hypothetical protein TNCV_4631481 [Trichonephila clavipes]|nr:hypothetical protein TNCV_4631481 [Trichonephila clavipes]
MATGSALTQNHSRSQSEIQGDLHKLARLEINSLHRAKINLTWLKPPAHHWYAAKSPGLSLQCRSSRAWCALEAITCVV